MPYKLNPFTGALDLIPVASKYISLVNQIVDVPNALAVETTAFTLTETGRLVTNGDALRISTWGRLVANGNAKTVRFYFGGTAIFNSGSQTPSGSTVYYLDVLLIRDSSSSIRYRYRFERNFSTTVVMDSGKLTGLTLSGSNVLKSTLAGTANADLTAEGALVEYIPVV